MRRAAEKLKEMLPNRALYNPQSGSQPISTTALRFASVVLDTLPIPGGGAVVRPFLDVVDGINVSAHSVPLNLRAPFT